MQVPSAVVLEGDCLDVLRGMESDSVDALVTDPPAGISFMSAKWDSDRGSRNAWIAWLTEVMAEALRVLKPGAHGLVWALPRTSHWTAMALEDAGFEIRDRIAHHFGSGFPKSANVSKHIDRMRNDDIRPVCRFLRAAIESSEHTAKTIAERFGFHPRMVEHWAARDTDSQPSVPKWEQWLQLKDLLGFSDEMDAEVWRLNGRKGKPGEAWYEREVIGKSNRHNSYRSGSGHTVGYQVGVPDITAPATEAAHQWEGWGTALKPSTEDWWLIRKPLSESSVARQVLKTSTGALNIDASRVRTAENLNGGAYAKNGKERYDGYENWRYKREGDAGEYEQPSGRFPSNLLLSHHPGCRPTGEMKRVKGQRKVMRNDQKAFGGYHGISPRKAGDTFGYADSDGTEEVAEYLCHPSCPVRLLDEQSGQLKSGKRAPGPRRQAEDDGWGMGTNGNEASAGGASRFFKTFGPSVEFHPDTHPGFHCLICDSYAPKYDKMSVTQTTKGAQWFTQDSSPETANIAETNTNPTEAHNGSVPDNAQEPTSLSSEASSSNENKSAHNAESASGCGQVTTEPIARNGAWDSRSELLVQNVRSVANLCERCTTAIAQSLVQMQHDQSPNSPLGLLSIPEHKRQILRQSLALFAESLGNTDTTPTTQSLSLLFGYVRDAMRRSTPTDVTENGLDPTQSISLETDSIDVGPGFLYRSKSSRRERNLGLEGMPEKAKKVSVIQSPGRETVGSEENGKQLSTPAANTHPTVKSLALCDYLVRLITPPGGTCLDPFAGSGSTGCSAVRQGFNFIGIEKEPEYVILARKRISFWANGQVGQHDKLRSPSPPPVNGNGGTTLQDSLWRETESSGTG